MAFAALVLTTAALLTAALARILALLVLVVTAALLLARLLLAALMLLSALVWIVRHYLDSFRKLPGGIRTVGLPTSSPKLLKFNANLVPRMPKNQASTEIGLHLAASWRWPTLKSCSL
ncbi:MAG: hypothetical protein JO289_24965 [Xanthobacteraceae bacterium]|nr:hypothetical protein [Xanthobacteraceae bacterium]